MKNFSESKTKNAEVTAMIAMNQTKEEKEMNILRLDALATRDGVTPPEIKILQCLEIGRPYIRSEFSKKQRNGSKQQGEDNSKRELVIIRLKQGMEVKDIAEEVGVSKQYVYQIKKDFNGE
jgi:DNA-binding NarL/FixJ family response regulator